MKKKLIVDISLFILMILEFSRMYMPTIIHEIIGILLLILIIIHLFLNKSYIKSIFNGKYNLKRVLILVVNIVFSISFISSLILGILSSQDLLKFMNVGNLSIISFHKISAYISLLCMGLHLGINFNQMFGLVTKRVKNKSLLYVLSLLIVLFGIYSCVKVDFFAHLTGKYGFSIVTGNVIINIIEYLSIVLMTSILMNFIYKKIERRGKQDER